MSPSDAIDRFHSGLRPRAHLPEEPPLTEFTWRPRGGLLQQYAEVYGPTTDAPQQFHTFVCLATMAAAVARNVWIQDGAQQLFLNLFVLLLAPSSLYRKSTCVGHGTELIRTLEDSHPGWRPARPHPLPTTVHPGKFPRDPPDAADRADHD